jgi:hypothetical protein
MYLQVVHTVELKRSFFILAFSDEAVCYMKRILELEVYDFDPTSREEAFGDCSHEYQSF